MAKEPQLILPKDITGRQAMIRKQRLKCIKLNNKIKTEMRILQNLLDQERELKQLES